MKLIIYLYQQIISPLHHLLGKSLFGSSYSCRYTPTCSEYAKQAFQKYGIIYGGFLTLKRFLNCHPYSKRPLNDPLK